MRELLKFFIKYETIGGNTTNIAKYLPIHYFIFLQTDHPQYEERINQIFDNILSPNVQSFFNDGNLSKINPLQYLFIEHPLLQEFDKVEKILLSNVFLHPLKGLKYIKHKSLDKKWRKTYRENLINLVNFARKQLNYPPIPDELFDYCLPFLDYKEIDELILPSEYSKEELMTGIQLASKYNLRLNGTSILQNVIAKSWKKEFLESLKSNIHIYDEIVIYDEEDIPPYGFIQEVLNKTPHYYVNITKYGKPITINNQYINILNENELINFYSIYLLLYSPIIEHNSSKLLHNKFSITYHILNSNNISQSNKNIVKQLFNFYFIQVNKNNKEIIENIYKYFSPIDAINIHTSLKIKDTTLETLPESVKQKILNDNIPIYLTKPLSYVQYPNKKLVSANIPFFVIPDNRSAFIHGEIDFPFIYVTTKDIQKIKDIYYSSDISNISFSFQQVILEHLIYYYLAFSDYTINIITSILRNKQINKQIEFIVK